MPNPVRILIAEDEAMIALFLTNLLEGMGYCVCATAETVSEVIAAAAAHRPDLIIADANLRDGSGVDAVKEILLGGFVPHIFVTGDPYRTGAAPGSIIVQKPFTGKALERAVTRALA